MVATTGTQKKYNLPWVCTGDFNEILRGHDKLGGLLRREVELEAFRDVVDELGFVDLGYLGRKYTWRGKRGDTIILERLDRAFATSTWLELFKLHEFSICTPMH